MPEPRELRYAGEAGGANNFGRERLAEGMFMLKLVNLLIINRLY